MSWMQRCAQMATVSALVVTATVACAARGTFERTLQVHGPVMLNVTSTAGDIQVQPGDGQVHIVGHVYAGNGWGSGNAEERLQQVLKNPPVEQSGNVIRVGHGMELNNISIDYSITVPKGTQVEASSTSGDISVSGLGGPLRASTTSGGIHANDLNGTVSLHDTSGDIRASIDQSPSVDVGDTSGSITLNNVHGMLQAGSVSGDISVSGAPMDGWRLHSVSGDVTLNTNGSGPFVVHASSVSGSIHNSHAGGSGATVRISTVSGDIVVH